MYIKNDTIISWGFIALFLGALLGSSFYIGVIILTPVRLGIIIASLVLFFQFSKMNNGYKVQPLLLLIFLFYTYQFIVGNYVSVFTATVESTTRVANTVFLYALLILLFLYGNIYKQYITILYKVSKFFMFILIIISIIEMVYRVHFHFSHVYVMPEVYGYIPTAFYTNQNDFLAIVSLLIIFKMLILKYLKNDMNLKKSDYTIFTFYIVYAIFLSIVTSSRINMIVLILIFFIFLLDYKKSLLFLLLSIVLIILIFPSLIDLYTFYMNSISFGQGHSTSMRLHLYIDALLNFSILGEGADNSSLFYLRLNNPDYEGMSNPHNYLLELLINNGYLFTISYISFNGYLFLKSILMKKYFLSFVFILYQFILLSSSSSLFLWPQYIYYIGFISILVNIHYKILNNNKRKEEKC